MVSVTWIKKGAKIMNDNFKHNYKYMYNTDWRDNRELHIRRLHNLKKALTLETGDVIFTDKKIISLITIKIIKCCFL